MKIRFSMLPLNFLVAFLFFGPLASNAQLPGMGIYFQAIARDKMENPAKDRKIYVQTTLLESNNNSNALFTELHITKSDGMGVFGLSIGLGNRTGGTASNLLAIPWEKGPILLNVKIAIEPISPLYNWDYTQEWIDLGTSPFGSVPYALYTGNGSSNDKKLNISDTAAMLAPYAKAVATIINNPPTPLVVLDSVNQKILQKVNIKDSNLVYVTPFQLSLNTFDTSSLSNRINNKLNLSDTSSLLSSYSKQTQVNNLLALKVNIADTSAMLGSRIGRDTLSLSNRINQKLNISDSIYGYITPSKLKEQIIDTNFLSTRINTKLNISDTSHMLSNYAKTNNLSRLAFSGNYNDIINKPIAISNIVNTVNGLTGDVLVNKTSMGIANVDNTSDANKPISILTNSALNNKVDKTAINAANGIPSLDANTKIPSYLLPAISFTSVTIANSSAQMQNIGTTALKGTVAVRTDISKTYILSVDNSSNINDWVEILNPGAPVQSVNGKLANVSLTTSDINEGGNEYFTQSKARLSLTANGPINYNAVSGLLSADTSTSNYSLVTRYALQQQNISTIASLNEKVNLSDTANMLYPYSRTIGIKKYIDSVAIVLNSNIVTSNGAIVFPDASASTKGIVQLNGDLSGTATAPIIANNAINTAKIMDGAIATAKVIDAAITDSKIATGISASKVGLGTVNNTSDLNKPISTLTQNALNLKLNTSDTAAMLSAYLTSIQNLNESKLNKIDTSAMLSAYLTSIQALSVNKLNLSDTAAMLNAYLTSLNYKEIASNKSNDATLGGSSPSVTLYPTQSAVKQYITNNASSGTTSSTSPWSIIGNSGMVDGTNFIGTTDAQPLNFVANNVNAGRIDVVALSGQTSFGYGSGVNTLKNTSNLYGTRNTSIGYQTLYNTVYGKENTAIGYQALYNNNTASGSTAIGYQAMYNANNISTVSQFSTSNTAIGYQALLGSSNPANNSGISNTAIGHFAEKNNSSGSNNTGIGDLSLYYNTTGQSNTAIGYNTLSSIITGSSNTAIGYNADVTNNVSNATAIGNGAIASTSNTIQLGNGSVAIVNTEGIYTSSNNTESNYQNSGALVVAGGVGVGKNLYVGGKINVERIDIKHLRGVSTLPVMALGSGAGTITSFVSNTGTDLAGNVTFKCGSGSYNSNNSIILTITFNIPYGTIPYVVISPANSTTAGLTAAQAVYVIANSNGFSIYSNSTALPALNYNYSWNYIVVQ
jgi:hypothetical protein